ncbi:MAG TPA: hypothetical protein VIF82_01895 [Burkholderiaceae bacterium]|jgi:hypothetical protein
METWKLILTLIVVIVIPAFGIYFYIKTFNGKNGERYIKMRTQGPFVPLSKEEIEEDEKRMKKSSSIENKS